MKHHAFLACHPAVNLLYFVLVLTFSMFFLHPLCIAVSLCAALWCAAQLNGGAAVRRTALWLAPTAILAALVNLAFNHEGATILAYLPSGNPLTLESIAYGFAAAAMLAAVVLWFSCWNTVMTSDKLMHLFARVVPALSLLLSMTLRFVPRFSRQLSLTVQVQRGLNGGEEPDGLWQRLGDILVHSLMPVCALTLVTVPKLFFTARASFFTILGRPYLTNARAKGLTAGRIRTAYILRNAATPIVARFFLSVGGAVGGTILVENVFAYPGLGTVLREAVQYRDYPMLQGVFLLSAVLVLLSLAAADVVNRRLDGEEEGP